MKTGTEIVQQYMEKEKVGLSALARRGGLTRQACRQRFVLQKDVTVKKFLEMMACLGYAMELKKVGYIRVVPSELEAIRNDNTQTGLFFCEDNDKYIAFDNRTGKPSEIEFDSEEKCIKYLNTIQ